MGEATRGAAEAVAQAPVRKQVVESLRSNATKKRRRNPSSKAPDGSECSVCYEPIETTDARPSTTLLCGHVFHSDCVEKWLERSGSCPFCRQPVDVAFWTAAKAAEAIAESMAKENENESSSSDSSSSDGE